MHVESDRLLELCSTRRLCSPSSTTKRDAKLLPKPIGDAIISAVNHAEVITKLVERLGSFELARKALGFMEVDVVDFNRTLAEHAGDLVRQTRALGLSLGDRSCLALALREQVPVLTADRTWSGVAVGIEVRLIR